MEKDKICSCCQHEVDIKQATELTEACRVYRIIQNITNAGCDAEVKKVKGELKILSVLKSKLAELSAIQNRIAIHRISKALLYISNYRVREVRKNGWVCGTYMSPVRERFERWIGCLFSETELFDLINSCAIKSELNQHQLDMLTVLLHNAPKTLVHRYYTSL